MYEIHTMNHKSVKYMFYFETSSFTTVPVVVTDSKMTFYFGQKSYAPKKKD